jgi:hypothetical protein
MFPLSFIRCCVLLCSMLLSMLARAEFAKSVCGIKALYYLKLITVSVSTNVSLYSPFIGLTNYF